MGATTIHRQVSADYDILGDDVYYPANHLLVRDLLGKLLTHLDAMALPDRAHRAARTLITETVWRWWDAVYENSVTSGQGCVAPVVMAPLDSDDPGRSNRWGWTSEAQYLVSLRAHLEMAKGECR